MTVAVFGSTLDDAKQAADAHGIQRPLLLSFRSACRARGHIIDALYLTPAAQAADDYRSLDEVMPALMQSNFRRGLKRIHP